MSFSGQVAFVTGAGSGIGRSTALLLGRGGANVAAVDLNEESARSTAGEITAGGGRALPLGVDVARRARVREAVARTVDEYGALDILINCAGIYPKALIVEMEEADWDRVINTHLKGTFLCCQAAARQMIQQGRGRIVNLVSGIAANGARSGGHYAAAKGGIIGLTKTLALELREHRIMVNAFSPGPTRTPMSSWSNVKPGEPRHNDLMRRHPLGLKEPEQAAEFAALLAGGLFGQTTGQIIHF